MRNIAIKVLMAPFETGYILRIKLLSSINKVRPTRCDVTSRSFKAETLLMISAFFYTLFYHNCSNRFVCSRSGPTEKIEMCTPHNSEIRSRYLRAFSGVLLNCGSL